MTTKNLITACAFAIRNDGTRFNLVLSTPSGVITGIPMFQNESFDKADSVIQNAFSQLGTERDKDKLYGDENFFVLRQAYIEVRTSEKSFRQRVSALAIRYDSIIACTIDTI